MRNERPQPIGGESPRTADRCRSGRLPRASASRRQARGRVTSGPVLAPTPTLAELARRAEAVGLAVRGAFHPTDDEEILRPIGVRAGTVVLLGFTGSVQWANFAGSAEAADGLPDPLDRWSQRVTGVLAADIGALAIYPGGAPRLSFQRLAARCEAVHQSPIGLLIHERWGLWHAYRGALLLSGKVELSPLDRAAHPCSACRAQPCLTSCPVAAFGADGFNLAACAAHVAGAAGSECRDRGCLARRACPVGAEFRYVDEQAKFHTAAFLRSVALTSATEASRL